MSGSGGGVRQRPDGAWEGRYYHDGRRRSVYGKTKRETQERLRSALTASERGERLPDQRRSTAAWLDTWLATDVRGRVRPQTVTSYEGTVSRYLRPALGRIPLAKLGVDDVGRMLDDMERRGLSPRTRQLTLTVLRIALSRAVEAGATTRNVAKVVRSIPQDGAERKPFTPAEVAALLEATREDPIGPLLTLTAMTGLRQGEVLGLRWDDVDLDAGTLTVHHTLDPRTRELGATKTKLSRRTITLPALVVAALREQQQRQRYDRLRAGRGWRDTGHVFTARNGSPWDARNVDRRYHAARERAGLPNLPFHYLRHFAATTLLEAGEELFTVSRILGHASIATTARFYSHVRPSMLQGAADRMDAVMRRAAGG